MPALSNPRHERFAQAIFAGLSGETRIARAQSTAYLTAYPNCSNGNSAEAAASRLLRRVKPIRELQAEANARATHKIDLSRERIGRELDKAARMATEQGNASALVSSALGIAKVFHSSPNDQEEAFSFKSATSMHDIGRKLLMTVGYENHDEASIELAIEANDQFVDRLEAIYHQAQHTRLSSERTSPSLPRRAATK